MSEAWVLPAIVGAAAAVWAVLRQRAKARREELGAGPAAMAGLRARALESTRAELGQPEAEAGSSAHGALMELGMEGIAATLVAFLDGSASLYLSTGGGVIGGGPHPGVSAAARAFVRAAEGFASALEPATSFPLPGAGRVAFVLLGDAERRRIEVPTQELEAPGHPLAGLYAAGHEVLTQLRLATPGAPR